MIHHIIKIAWAERRINAWILLELILVFCVLWFCYDYLSLMAKRSFEPTGFDIEHTYRIGIGTKEEGRLKLQSNDSVQTGSMLDDIWTIYDRIKKHPSIENVSYSIAGHPYAGSFRGRGYYSDTTIQSTQIKLITPDFFDVFKISMLSGIPFSWDNIINNPVIISADSKNIYAEKAPEQVQYLADNKEGNNKRKVLGVASRVKPSEYESYSIITYEPLQKSNTWTAGNREVCVRVKPEADKNFEEQFIKDMRTQLEIGSYYLAMVKPISNDRKDRLSWRGFTNNFKNISAAISFLLINIFLGVIGTFWLRTQSRRSEVGLRIALGASKERINKMFVIEAMFLLFTASFIATIICVNITATDFVDSLGLPVPNREGEPTGINEYLYNYVLTFVTLSIITIVAVWYPARKASYIQPSESLKSE